MFYSRWIASSFKRNAWLYLGTAVVGLVVGFVVPREFWPAVLIPLVVIIAIIGNVIRVKEERV